MKFRWDKKYLYWGVTAFAVICASMLFYFGIFHMDVLIRGFRILTSVMMPVIFRSGHRLSADTGCEFSGTEDLLSSYEEKEDGYQ